MRESKKERPEAFRPGDRVVAIVSTGATAHYTKQVAVIPDQRWLYTLHPRFHHPPNSCIFRPVNWEGSHDGVCFFYSRTDRWGNILPWSRCNVLLLTREAKYVSS